ncbi:MAG: hypothetical protein ACK55I_43955, partial [bacterium]
MAACLQRATFAVRLARLTNGSAQLHDCLIVLGRMRTVQQLGRQFGKLAFSTARVNWGFNARIAAQHPVNIAIDHRMRKSERERSNGGSSVLSHT